MAKLTKNEKYIVDMYVRYFGKTPTDAQIADYADLGKPKLILAQIRGESQDAKEGMSSSEYVNSVFQNLFGRNASTKELNKYSKFVDKGEDLPINAIVKAAKPSDKAVYQTKQAVALFIAEKGSTTNIDLDKITKDTYANVYDLKAKKVKVDSVEELKTKVDAMKDNASGQTITLTTGVDTKVGSDKGDLFEGIVDGVGNTTLTALDSIDGKEGKDTLNILNAKAAALELPAGLVVKNVEIVNVKSAHDVGVTGAGKSFDVSGFTGLTDLNITQAKDVFLTAAATTNVNVSGTTGAAVNVDGGKDVTVTDATAGNDITIGATTVNAGTITVTDTKQGTGAIAIDGGTDVTVTATATEATGTITVGDTSNAAAGVTADMATGAINVTQNLVGDGAGAFTGGAIKTEGGSTVNITVNANSTATGATTNDDITVGAITVNGSAKTTTVTVTQNDNAKTFTSAKVAEVKESTTITFKDVTAGETVTLNSGANTLTFTASKDLTAAEVAAAFANLSEGDLQASGGKVGNGVFTGKFSTAWTSASANGAAVVFTAISDSETDITIGGTAALTATQVKVNGVAASGGVESSNATVFGAVTITDSGDNKITTVTVDGYANSTVVSDALTTLTLKNSAGTMNVDVDAANTFTLNVDDINHAVSLDAVSGADIKTLTINATGEASDFGLTAAAVETLTIAATADLDLTGSTLTALKTATITGAGDVTLGDLSALASFATLTASAATGDISAEVDADVVVTTGSGNDTITVTAGATATAISKAIDLGAGDDTLILTDDTTAVPTAAVKGGDGVDTISMTFTSADSYDNTELFKNAISGFERLEINNTYGVDGDTLDTLTLDMEKLGFNYVITNGTDDGDAGNVEVQDRISLTNLAANATVELNANGLVIAALKTATGTADVMKVVTNVTTSAVDFGTFTVASVETVNITVNDTQLDDNSDDVIDSNDIVEVATLNLTADAAKTVNVIGNSSLTLDTVSTTITKVDASAMTGALTYTADGATAGTEVIAGAGNDTLRASGENDVLKGNAGDDTFYAGNLTTVYGGAGADKFYFATPTQLSKVSTIADLGSGDTIYLIDNENTNAVVDKFYAAGAQYNANTTTTFEAKVNASLVQTGEGEATWFQHSGNTYIVIDNDDANNIAAGAVDTYNAGKDVVIEITGLVDLSTASFNATTGTLEIA